MNTNKIITSWTKLFKSWIDDESIFKPTFKFELFDIDSIFLKRLESVTSKIWLISIDIDLSVFFHTDDFERIFRHMSMIKPFSLTFIKFEIVELSMLDFGYVNRLLANSYRIWTILYGFDWEINCTFLCFLVYDCSLIFFDKEIRTRWKRIFWHNRSSTFSVIIWDFEYEGSFRLTTLVFIELYWSFRKKSFFDIVLSQIDMILGNF
jgi:hypothetical protein